MVPDYQPRELLHFPSALWLIILSSQSQFSHNRYCCDT